MEIGMLWFDSNHAMAVSERVELAANYYKEKYGRVATLCFVHPSTLSEPSKIGRTVIKPMDTVQPNHFWLGVKPPGQGLKPSGQALRNARTSPERIRTGWR